MFRARFPFCALCCSSLAAHCECSNLLGVLLLFVAVIRAGAPSPTPPRGLRAVRGGAGLGQPTFAWRLSTPCTLVSLSHSRRVSPCHACRRSASCPSCRLVQLHPLISRGGCPAACLPALPPLPPAATPPRANDTSPRQCTAGPASPACRLHHEAAVGGRPPSQARLKRQSFHKFFESTSTKFAAFGVNSLSKVGSSLDTLDRNFNNS